MQCLLSDHWHQTNNRRPAIVKGREWRPQRYQWTVGHLLNWKYSGWRYRHSLFQCFGQRTYSKSGSEKIWFHSTKEQSGNIGHSQNKVGRTSFKDPATTTPTIDEIQFKERQRVVSLIAATSIFGKNNPMAIWLSYCISYSTNQSKCQQNGAHSHWKSQWINVDVFISS